MKMTTMFGCEKVDASCLQILKWKMNILFGLKLRRHPQTKAN